MASMNLSKSMLKCSYHCLRWTWKPTQDGNRCRRAHCEVGAAGGNPLLRTLALPTAGCSYCGSPTCPRNSNPSFVGSLACLSHREAAQRLRWPLRPGHGLPVSRTKCTFCSLYHSICNICQSHRHQSKKPPHPKSQQTSGITGCRGQLSTFFQERWQFQDSGLS